MPFLRFSRDKRGYETTALVQPYRGRQGRARQKVLYWFRTPPNVKVGRTALDQDAIRWIEEHNPDIEFDWPKILEATPPPAAVSDDQRGRRPRRTRSEKPEREGPERRSTPRAAEPLPRPPVIETTPVPPITGAQPVIVEPEPEQEALEHITHPDAEEAAPQQLSAVESVLGREQLIRFRARYAELQARIIERGGEAPRVEELRAQAEALNPDSWVTVEEARKSVADFEPKIRELRAALGLKRRRRSRRGGRRRQGGPTIESSVAQADSTESSSDSPDTLNESGETDDRDES